MRYPLFVLLRYAKDAINIPDDRRHSPILSLEWMRERLLSLWLWSWEKPNGVFIIDEIADRMTRGAPIRACDFASVRWRIAQTIYSGTPLANYRKNHVYNLKERCGEGGYGLRVNGEWTVNYAIKLRKPIAIVAPPTAPCRWCRKPVFYKEAWVSPYLRTAHVHCNARDCRRMNHLATVPQSRGGIDLTPTQKASLDREAWDTQRAINYFQLIAKEVKRGRKSTHDVRRRAPHHSSNHFGASQRGH